jgi:hypothetical protein
MAKKRIAKMVGGSLAGGACPPGVWCLNTGLLVFGVLLMAVVLGALYFMHYTYQKTATWATKPTVVVVEKPAPATLPTPILQVPTDPRFAPLSPERSYGVPPDLRGFPSPPISAGIGAVPINFPTRGVPDQFQQIGVLTAPGGSETSASPTRTILPLFGRKLLTNRDRWNYYTRTDGINPVQVPIQFKRRNCDDDTGCDEIMEGDSVGVPILGQSYVANVYRYSTPRYIPF